MEIKVGDVITRWLAGTIPMELAITAITDERIICGAWEFDRATGAEIDEDIGWGPPPKYGATGSFIKVSGVTYIPMSDEEALDVFTRTNKLPDMAAVKQTCPTCGRSGAARESNESGGVNVCYDPWHEGD